MEKNVEWIIDNELSLDKTNYELRLSDEEKAALKKEYPHAVFTEISDRCRDGKTWFNITIK